MSSAECFIDTNILIHFKPLSEIDWLALTNATEVVLTVPAKVVAELDDKKEFGNTQRLRKRAQDALRRLRECKEQGGVVRPGVTLRLVADEPTTAEWSDLGLDRDVPDDRIIAALITQRLDPKSPTFLVTGDYGPELKCESRGIPVLALSKAERLPDLMGEQDQELGQLRQRVAQLEDREPKLKLELVGSTGRGQHLQIVLARPAQGTDTGIEEALRQEQVTVENLVQVRHNPSVVMLADHADVQRYRNEIPAYLRDFKAYLEAKREYEIETALTIKLECVVVNAGRAPAEGLHISLHVPDGPDVFDKDSVPEEPKRPDRPEEPRTTMHLMLGRMNLGILDPMRSSFDFLRTTPPVVGESRAPRIKKTNSFQIEYTRRELPHGFEVMFEPFYSVFRTPESVKSFAIDYELHAKNLAEPTKGQVHLILQLGQPAK